MAASQAKSKRGSGLCANAGLTAQEFRARIKAVVAEINRTHDVDSLCRELPGRVQQVKAAEGGRINK